MVYNRYKIDFMNAARNRAAVELNTISGSDEITHMPEATGTTTATTMPVVRLTPPFHPPNKSLAHVFHSTLAPSAACVATTAVSARYPRPARHGHVCRAYLTYS